MDFEEFKRQLGAQVQDFRRRKGLTQEKLGELTSLSEDTISSIERGVNIPKIETIFRIANALNVSLAELLNVAAGSPEPGENQEKIDRLIDMVGDQRGEFIDAVINQVELLMRIQAGGDRN